MKLTVRRSQRDAGMLGNKVMFSLVARIQPSAEEQTLIKRYKLGKLTVYDSEAARKHAAAVQDGAQQGGFGGLAKMALGAGRLSMSLRCTLDSLMEGQRIECQELPELLSAEEAIVDACKVAKAFLATAQSFDGNEHVVEF
jgi:hypothetical protein